MPVMVVEVYNALRSMGVDDDMARAAARSVMGVEDRAVLATKADVAELRYGLKIDAAELKADLIKWNVGLLVAMTAIFAGIVKLL